MDELADLQVIAPVLSRKDKFNRITFYVFLALLFVRFFLSGIPLLVYTIVTFLVPFVYFYKNRHFHLFKFDVRDTLQSIVLNIGYALGFILILFIIGLATNNFSWVILFRMDASIIIKIFIISFFQEMLFRYFIEENLIKFTNNTYLGITATSIISAVLIYPPLGLSATYLFMGLMLGWVFEHTKDIYGVTLSHFLIYLFTFLMV